MQKIALVGNPNAGKTTLFNTLTGLNQKVGNYPGITVEKKSAVLALNTENVLLFDLPGIYSLYPNSKDEEVVSSILTNPNHPDHPDKVLVVGDGTNLERSIALCQQIRALGMETALAINRSSSNQKKGIQLNTQTLEKHLGCPVLPIEAIQSSSLQMLREWMLAPDAVEKSYFVVPINYRKAVAELQESLELPSAYHAWVTLASDSLPDLDKEKSAKLQSIRQKHGIVPKRLRVKESLDRNAIWKAEKDNWINSGYNTLAISEKLDRIFLHPVLGYVLFFGFLLLIFQAIYSWSEKPMEWIENSILWASTVLSDHLPTGPINQVITEGILPGLAGIFVFIPQIAILFFFLGIMEGSGYMSRVVFLMDRWMRPFGLNGKSVVPFISGVACAIPAIMAARTIENHKERLITILVTPFMTCSARLPIYTIIIGLIIPEGTFLGFGYKGITLLGLYVIGVIAALLSAYVLQKTLKSPFKSYLILEMPDYSVPIFRNVVVNLLQKTWSFVWGAGKIIMAVSILLWGLAAIPLQSSDSKIAASGNELENSVLGAMGRSIEPVIAPLGYDWKMGIGIITSFAAREVFVGTMATLYSIGDEENEKVLTEKLRDETNARTGKKAYDLPTGFSLLLFYAFAMQCMSTLAIVKKETNSWKWPIVQFVSMTLIAYLAAFTVYQILS